MFPSRPAGRLPPVFRNREAATARSVAVRRQRVELKRALRHGGYRQLARVLEDPPDYTARMAVYDLLLACRHVGPARAAAVLREADRMTIHRQVGDLTDRQRRLLLTIALREAATRPA